MMGVTSAVLAAIEDKYYFRNFPIAYCVLFHKIQKMTKKVFVSMLFLSLKLFYNGVYKKRRPLNEKIDPLATSSHLFDFWL